MNNPLPIRIAGCIAGLAFMVACRTSRPSNQPHVGARQAPAGLEEKVDFVQFRWEGSSSHQQARYREPLSEQSVALNDSVVLDIRGIDSAWASAAGRDTAHWDVVLLLSRPGAAQFGATTATHVGKRLAILVDGAIVGMPVIRSTLGPRLPLVSYVPRAVADSLATRVNRAITELRPWQPAVFPRDLDRNSVH